MFTRVGAGAAYGTAKSGMGILVVGTIHPELIMRSILPAIMAGIVGLFGLIVDLMILSAFSRFKYPLYAGALHMGAGFCVGFSGLASAISIGIIGDAGIRGVAQQPRLFIGMVLLLIFAEVLGIYGLIIALSMVANAGFDLTCK